VGEIINNIKYKALIIIVTTSLFFLSSISAINISTNKNFDGYILYTPEYIKQTYLINYEGDIINQWESDYIQGLGVYLLENRYLLRCDLPYLNPTFFGGGITGQVEMFNWEGNLIWNYILSNDKYCLHHDIEPLPNGNILMISWEYHSRSEAINAGRNPNNISESFWTDCIFEIEPFSNEIVWEWCSWDHLIQDYDETKQNYGIIKDHPDLIDINLVTSLIGGDWAHVNSINYNEQLNQILICSRNLNEIFVIDRNTSNIVYRWGNSQNYRVSGNKQLFGPHDARWTDNGNILIFNNGGERGYSSVDEIVPYGENNPIWVYDCGFYANILSGAQRLSNGNTLICNGPKGKFFEVTLDKQIVWEYINPYPNYQINDVFTIRHYTLDEPEEEDLDCEGNLNWKDVKSKVTIEGSFKVKNIGKSESLLDWKISSFPDWGNWTFNPESGKNLTPEDGDITVFVSVIAPKEKSKTFEGYIVVENQNNSQDFDVIPVYLTTYRNKIASINFFLRIFDNFPVIKKIQNLFLN